MQGRNILGYSRTRTILHAGKEVHVRYNHYFIKLIVAEKMDTKVVILLLLVAYSNAVATSTESYARFFQFNNDINKYY